MPEHKLVRWERSVRWHPGIGFRHESEATCLCGAHIEGGVMKITAARQWVREHADSESDDLRTGSDQ